MSELPEKQDYPVDRVRRFLEPGPTVLVSSAWKGETNVMTLGWHIVLGLTPSLVGLRVHAATHSHAMIRDSGECVINLPTTALTDTVVGIGNCSGRDVDKFAQFGLTRQPAAMVGAPLIGECHACFECRLHDDSLADRYNFFVFEVVKAHVAPLPDHPETLHYTGDCTFMLAGRTITRRELFRREMV